MFANQKKPAFPRSFAFIITALLISASAFGQVSGEKNKDTKHSLYKGSKALQFSIASSLRLGSFQGVALSGKKQFSEKSAIRIGVDLYLSVADYDFNSVRGGQAPGYTIRSSVSNTESITFRIQYMRYYSLKEAIKAYWATGPLFRFGRYFFEERRNDVATDYTRRENIDWAAGATGVLGVEWFASRNIGIHAEYFVTFDYAWERQKSKYVSGIDITNVRDRTQGVRLNTSDVKFGLSAYF